MIEPGIYRVSGKHTASFGVVYVLDVTDESIKCRKMDGQEVSMSRKMAESLRWTRLDRGRARTPGNCGFPS